MESQVLRSETSTAIDKVLATTAPPEQRLLDMNHRLADIQSAQLRGLLERQDALIARVNALASITDVADAERQRSIIDADLQTVRVEIAKRNENVGVMAAELFGLYDELGLQAQKANTDSPEDAVKRQRAQSAVQSAMEAVATAKANVATAKGKVATTEGGWNPIGKSERIEAAKAEVVTAEAAVTDAEAALSTAQTGIGEVEAQIEIDRADRIRHATLSENFTLIRQFTENATRTLREDIEATEGRRSMTATALTSALTKKAETARDLDALRDKMRSLERDLSRENVALGEIPDQGSSAYAEQQKIVTEIETKMVTSRGEELKLNTMLMALNAAIEANRSSLAGLTSQRDTAGVFVIKLEVAEKTAAILGHNIDRMVKNTTQEAASDALDRASDKMIITTVELGIQAEVASAKLRNEAIARHDTLMDKLHSARASGDQAMSTEAARYIELDSTIRKGYAARGIDLDMGHLQAAAESVGIARKPAPVTDTTSVEY